MSTLDITAKNDVAQSAKKQRILGALVYVLFFVLMVVTLSFKSYYFTDELLSYVLANNTVTSSGVGDINISFPAGVQIYPGSAALNIVLAPTDEGKFNYGQVLENQECDTHPPLYYILLHTLCSFFTGVFSKWFAATINIIFALLTLFVLRKLICYFTDDKFILFVISFAFMLSPCILNSVACLRMYIMAMFWVTLYTYLLVRYTECCMDRRFYVTLFFIAFFGTLTHYHCALYFVLASIFFVALQIKRTEYRAASMLCAVLFCAFISACLFFPAMIQHLFYREHGSWFAQNLANFNYSGYRLKLALSFINKQLFGYLLSIIVILIIIVHIYGKRKNLTQQKEVGYCIVLLPVIAFLCIVTKTMPLYPYTDELIRYFVPCFALLFVSVLQLLFTGIKQCMNGKLANLTILLTSFAVVAFSWMNMDTNRAWLYRGYDNGQYCMLYKNVDCIQIGTVDCYKYMPQIFDFSSFTLFPNADMAKNSAKFQELMGKSAFVIGISSVEMSDKVDSDIILYNLLQNFGDIRQFNITKQPYFYDKLYTNNVAHGNIYYITRKASIATY